MRKRQHRSAQRCDSVVQPIAVHKWHATRIVVHKMQEPANLYFVDYEWKGSTERLRSMTGRLLPD